MTHLHGHPSDTVEATVAEDCAAMLPCKEGTAAAVHFIRPQDRAERKPFGAITVNVVDFPAALEQLDDMIRDDQRHYVCFCEANLFVHAHRNPEVAAALNHAGMTLPDGTLLLLMSRLLGTPLPQRVPGPSFMLAVCEFGLARGYRHFFYGGQDGVAQELAQVLQARYPELIVAGTYSPPFYPLTDHEENEARQAIEKARPDLLWVGLSEPQQSLWMAARVQQIDVPVMLGVGAAFDFHSGRVPWAPRWIRRLGMEWAYRSLTGGKRIFKRNLWCVPLSFLLMLREVWRSRVWRRPR